MKYVVSLILVLSVFCCGAAWADDTMTLEQLEKTIECSPDTIQRIEITNGQPLFGVKLAGAEKDKLVSVPSESRKSLIQKLIASGMKLNVQDGLLAWLKYKFSDSHSGEISMNSAQDQPLTITQLANTLREGGSAAIKHVYVIDDSNMLSVKLAGSESEREVVVPAELKQDMLDQFARKGIKVEHKAPKLDLAYMLPGFLLGMLALGVIYMCIPMKLSTERSVTTGDKSMGTAMDKAVNNPVDDAVEKPGDNTANKTDGKDENHD